MTNSTDQKDPKYQWDLSPLLAGDDDPNIEKYRQKITEEVDAFVAKWRDRDDYLSDPAVLKEAIEHYNELEEMEELGKESFYFGLRAAQDTANTDIKAKENLSTQFYNGIINKLQFFYINVGKIDPEIQKQMLKDESLEPYRHWLERRFETAKYKLSEAEEKIMTLKSLPAYEQWVQMTDTFLSKEEREVLKADGSKGVATLEEMGSLIQNPDKKIRESSGRALSEIYAKHADLAEAEVNAVLTNKKIDDELRGYTRPDQSRHVADDIDSDVVDALVKAVSDSYDIPRRFMGLKAKLLKQDKFEYYERGLGYGDVKKEYGYEDSVNLVSEVFEKLDPEFNHIFNYMVKDRQIDVFPRKGKTGGAFCAGVGIKQPTYVMLNHTNTLRDVGTIAHEIGHAINDELIKQQKGINYGTPTSTAEVASTFMEDFVFEKLLKEADEEEELNLRISKLNDLVATTFRQIACYRFEQDLHRVFREKGYISKDEINDIFCKNMTDYLGDHAEGAENWWVYWSHFRRFFYVYSYASGLLISKSLQSKVRENPEFIKKVKIFLGTGLAKSPKQIFEDMDIDITQPDFWAVGLKEIENELTEAEALAKKLGKI